MYCPAGATSPHRCPHGQATTVEGAKAEGDCVPCPNGYLCNAVTMVGAADPLETLNATAMLLSQHSKAMLAGVDSVGAAL